MPSDFTYLQNIKKNKDKGKTKLKPSQENRGYLKGKRK